VAWAVSPFAPPVPLQLRHEPVRQEHVRRTAALCDFPSNAHANPRPPVGCEHVANVEADDLRQAKAGAEGEREDQVVADIADGRLENQPLLVGR
jgi:hypothetical protein